MAELATAEVTKSLESALRSGHPWVYRNHVAADFRAAPGWVRVRAGRFVGYGIWDPDSPIALRMFSARGVPDAYWFAEAVKRAWDLRAPLRTATTTAFRWLYGEGDGLPGITVDFYDGYAVLVTYANALDRVVPHVVAALRSTTELAGIVHKSRSHEPRLLVGKMPPRDLVIEEHGARLHADLLEGQKTGLFLDHRENRQFLRSHATGKRVLNLFSYTGAFSIATALGGAERVTSVDLAAPSMARARDNFALNGLAVDAHEFVVADVYEYLERASDRFDVVICDPPSLAKSKEQKPNALKAYVRLNARAITRVTDGGWFAAASCTSVVGPEEFRETMARAAETAKRRLQIIHEAGQALDHPVMVQHHEGRYLKFVVARVVPLA